MRLMTSKILPEFIDNIINLVKSMEKTFGKYLTQKPSVLLKSSV